MTAMRQPPTCSAQAGCWKGKRSRVGLSAGNLEQRQLGPVPPLLRDMVRQEQAGGRTVVGAALGYGVFWVARRGNQTAVLEGEGVSAQSRVLLVCDQRPLSPLR